MNCFNNHYPLFLVKDLYVDNKNKYDKVVKNINESLIILRNSIKSKEIPQNDFNKQQTGKGLPSDLATIIAIIICDFLMFYQFSLSPQVIITYKYDIYELPHELPNDLRLRILENLEILGKCLNFIE